MVKTRSLFSQLNVRHFERIFFRLLKKRNVRSRVLTSLRTCKFLQFNVLCTSVHFTLSSNRSLELSLFGAFPCLPYAFLHTNLDFQHTNSGAPWVRNFGNLSMREILVMTSAYARPPAHPPVQTLGEGEWSPKATRPGVGGGE